MIICRTDRAYAVIGRRFLTPLICENAAPTTVLRRLNDRVQNNRIRQRHQRSIATTANPPVETQHGIPTALWPVKPVSDTLESPPILSTTAEPPKLPRTCPGCGALTQGSEPTSPGFYTRDRRAVKIYLRSKKRQARLSNVESLSDVEEGVQPEEQEEAEEEVLQVDTETIVQDAPKDAEKQSVISEAPTVPLCDRCHDLIHNSRGQSIAHPSIDNIADSISESPFKRNHIYHVIDAADFPLSVIPGIFNKLELAKARSQNRRSQHDFSSKPTVSFIVTRSDLLAPTKEMVDSMMPYFQSVLRRALGRVGKDMRLGNVHLVSAKRGWWTKEIKEEIWKRGGGNWMVGKVNVGKSNLFEVLFPKGSGDRGPAYAELQQKQKEQETPQSDIEDEYVLDETKLLPPAQPETPFPVFPVVSSLPGTTASPIRLPFGSHKGELIDLPGLERGDLERYVLPENRLDLVMTHRHNVEQYVIKPGQSLILGGGLIRITPQLDQADRSMTMLAYPFVPLKAHVTSTEKAALQQSQQRESGIESILAPNVGAHMSSAGPIDLSTDVTKSRAGSVIRSGVEVSKLPFRVYATDILVEGLGWIELVCQVRRRSTSQPGVPAIPQSESVLDKNRSFDSDQKASHESEFAPFGTPMESIGTAPSFPAVEVFSPNGKHIASRPCLEAWRRWTAGRMGKNISKGERKRKYLVRTMSRT